MDSYTRFILVVGSGFGVDQWMIQNKRYVVLFDRIIALNTAWKLLVEHNIRFSWYRSSDFRDTGKYVPDVDFDKWVLQLPKGPIWYDQCGGTILLEVLYGVANMYVHCDTIVCCIGCDLDYSRQQTHFYGNGVYFVNVQNDLKQHEPDLVGKNADPLRFGKQKVINALERLRDIQSIKFVNLSDNPVSLLPFQRCSISRLFTRKLILKRRLHRFIEHLL